MQVVIALVLLVTCELCLAIRVPITWDQSASEVKQEIKNDNDDQFSIDTFKPQSVQPESVTQDEKPIPVEYFQYTAKKPQSAIDIAKFHGVQSPENHYKAYPIKPHTGKQRPVLGKHHLLDKGNTIHRPLQEFADINGDVVSHVIPVQSNYEIFHPYEAETPALQDIYKDPVLTKIRNDLENSKNRLQTYEKETGEPDIHKDEYLENPKKTDNRFTPHRNIPAPYEIHRPQRRPVYYRPIPKQYQREDYLNHRLKHPWNQHAKIRPMHYRPVKKHIQQLRQNHALKYDDERNEYPQVQVLENYSSDPKDGHDIYEKGKEKFVQLRNNVDESISKATEANRPTTYQKLEMQNNDDVRDGEEEDEFVPIKNYAQVRKSETYKHLPRSAALEDAESFDEIRNAPRLREAVKSTKAQTVYSEEGYEDSAYDHAGEQKHASENEGHGGYLKEHELSNGKYKTPSESAKIEDGGGSAYRDQVIHAEKWNENNKDKTEETNEEDYSEDEHEKSIEADGYQDTTPEDNVHRNKRENDLKNDTDTSFSIPTEKINNTAIEQDVDKQKTNFKVPEIDFNSTFLSEKEILKLGKIKAEPKNDDIKQKYPYYFKNLKAISKHSPLRYAENLKFIPKKSNGGTEFYDSRAKFECPEVDDVPDPIPEKLNRPGHPDDNNDKDSENSSSSKGDENYDTVNKTPRLKGLGDKIDCFKAKYFGENPLDSPFFKEDIIPNPEPVTLPSLAAYKLLKDVFNNEQVKTESKHNYILDTVQKDENKSDLFSLIEKLRNDQNKLKDSLVKSTNELSSSLNNTKHKNNTGAHLKHQSNVYSDVLDNIQNNLKNDIILPINVKNITSESSSNKNITYRSFQNKEDITQMPSLIRKKRSSSFVYEPYKIIRDSQFQDSKKTTTSSNISPLIRQLQSSRIVDRVPKFNQEIEQLDKHVKRNVNTRVYKDIGRKEREPSIHEKSVVNPSFVDINEDSRRGEPRYEIRPANHKSRYTPVKNKKAISVEDYNAHSSTDTSMQTKSQRDKSISTSASNNQNIQSRSRNSASRPNLDRSIQNIAASSNTVRKTISTIKPTQIPPEKKYAERDNSNSEEDYEEYDDDEEEEQATTTTTQRPSFRRRIRLTTTTEKVFENTERPKLKLVTRFKDHTSSGQSSEIIENLPESFETRSRHQENNNTQDTDLSIPKYREKKKKSTESTLVTDTKRYGDDDDDMQREEVDSLISVKQNMDDYMPLYEKEQVNRSRKKSSSKTEINEHDDKKLKHKNENGKKTDFNNNDTDEDDDEVGDDHDDDDGSDIDEDSHDDGDNNHDDDDDHDNDDDHDDSEENEDDVEEDEDDNDHDDENSEQEPETTTPEPTKRTLAITTDAPTPTVAAHATKPETKPIITRKKVEIHKELPVNKSAPHVTQFKQDIKEVEIIKEIPRVSKKKPQKHIEALELYRDDNLAKDVNKLGGVEVFKEGIDLKNGPRHGGNYRSLVEPGTNKPLRVGRKSKPTKDDTETSQTEFTKQIELDDDTPTINMHGGNLRSLNDGPKTRGRGRNSKLIELSDIPSPSMHGGNLKHPGRGGRNNEKSQKYIELDDNNDRSDDDADPSSDHESFSNSRSSGRMHGGNYRSAKIVEEKRPDSEHTIRNKSKAATRTSAAILNSFVQATPILTTTPAYILDPSKRMYYYVDA